MLVTWILDLNCTVSKYNYGTTVGHGYVALK